MKSVKRNLIVKLSVCALSLSSCSALHKSTTKTPAGSSSATAGNTGTKVEFIEGIHTRAKPKPIASHNSKNVGISSNVTMGSAILENASSWQFKYAQMLDVPVENVLNGRLYSFIDEWMGTPYRMGGKTKDGIDCSGFVNTLMNAVFQLNLIGNSVQLFNQVTRLSKTQLHEGDLVFFRIHHKRISHVGIYLENDKFVHASTSNGVMISDLKEAYWKRYYAGGGRL
ncbi:MAG: C40 family peptidase [Chitinophaga sp.]|uniref:C40 family peptidase n=1 Tax=Chitinophaga sp. TaxID=1869181 RepID=UPI0025C07670|nr:NlpC/P60 family protein [Chitinophaga sp.]MBV8252233.1 C40 family peptidase [Chitinophaga sp.]